MRTLSRLRPGLWRLVVINSVAIIVTSVVLAASPAPVHVPGTHWEALMLVGAAALLLVGNLVIVGPAVARYVIRIRETTREEATHP